MPVGLTDRHAVQRLNAPVIGFDVPNGKDGFAHAPLPKYASMTR